MYELVVQVVCLQMGCLFDVVVEVFEFFVKDGIFIFCGDIENVYFEVGGNVFVYVDCDWFVFYVLYFGNDLL